MKNMWLLILSMIPGLIVAEQSLAEWTYNVAKVSMGFGLQAITYTASTAKSVGSIMCSTMKNMESSDVTIGACAIFGARELCKKSKNFKAPSYRKIADLGCSGVKDVGHALKVSLTKTCLKIGAKSVLFGFLHHALTSHTPMTWIEKQKKKS